MAQHSVVNLAKSIALENQIMRTNVRVNAICPGCIPTSMTTHLIDNMRNRDKGKQANDYMLKVGRAEGQSSLFPCDPSSELTQNGLARHREYGCVLGIRYVLRYHRSYARRLISPRCH